MPLPLETEAKSKKSESLGPRVIQGAGVGMARTVVGLWKGSKLPFKAELHYNSELSL